MQGHELSEVKHEKGLDIKISNTLKMSDQRTTVSNKANMLPGLVSRNFDHKSLELFKKLCSAFVRPHLEYAAQVWLPNYIKSNIY